MQGDDPQRSTRSIDATDHDDYFFGGYPAGVTRVESIVRGLVHDSDIQRIINGSDVQELSVAKVYILIYH